MMQNVDELGQAIHDRQIRYRHEAYRDQFVSHPVRRWIGTHLVGFGESILNHGNDHAVLFTVDRRPT
ncbi:MAG: hypothetical protein M3490_03050 [Chloroflexota bacterium]|nr:hypothetical protein [Chloroflexota bacterium]